MIASYQQLIRAWSNFQSRSGGLQRPENEEDYQSLEAMMHYLLDTHDCEKEPYASLLHLIGTYMHDWELEHDQELKDMQLPPHQLLAFLMDQQGVSQYQLEKEGLVNQGNLSKILAGKQAISKALAKKLAWRFKVGVEVFI
jgi:antitoxin component HigA of HigAB toxin-antitoxin module